MKASWLGSPDSSILLSLRKVHRSRRSPSPSLGLSKSTGILVSFPEGLSLYACALAVSSPKLTSNHSENPVKRNLFFPSSSS